MLRLDADPAARTLPDLLRGGSVADALAVFADAHPGGERRAIASLWSAYLFAGTIAPVLTVGARLGAALPPDGSTLALRLAPETGLPAAVHVGPGPATPMPLSAQVDRLLADHVAPMIPLLRTETGLSARLLWENAGGYLFWTLGVIAAEMPERAAEARDALLALHWPREACSALTLMRADALAGHAMPRRRVCCLRHALPGSTHCAGICPLLRGGEGG